MTNGDGMSDEDKRRWREHQKIDSGVRDLDGNPLTNEEVDKIDAEREPNEGAIDQP